MPPLFDLDLRSVRRERAARQGIEPFLYRRALSDCLERLGDIARRFERALLIGCLDPAAADGLAERVGTLEVRDPSPLLARSCAGQMIDEERWHPEPASYDLIVSIGTLDTVNEVPRALAALRIALKPDSLLIGAMSGGDTLPQLRAAMRAADSAEGAAAPRVHPRIEPSALASLLENAGFERPVVDVDRVQARYDSLARLIGDLRAMGATSVLANRSPPLSRKARAAAEAHFREAARDGRTTETFDLLHFAAWSPKSVAAPIG